MDQCEHPVYIRPNPLKLEQGREVAGPCRVKPSGTGLVLQHRGTGKDNGQHRQQTKVLVSHPRKIDPQNIWRFSKNMQIYRMDRVQDRRRVGENSEAASTGENCVKCAGGRTLSSAVTQDFTKEKIKVQNHQTKKNPRGS